MLGYVNHYHKSISFSSFRLSYVRCNTAALGFLTKSGTPKFENSISVVLQYITRLENQQKLHLVRPASTAVFPSACGFEKH